MSEDSPQAWTLDEAHSDVTLAGTVVYPDGDETVEYAIKVREPDGEAIEPHLERLEEFEEGVEGAEGDEKTVIDEVLDELTDEFLVDPPGEKVSPSEMSDIKEAAMFRGMLEAWGVTDDEINDLIEERSDAGNST